MLKLSGWAINGMRTVSYERFVAADRASAGTGSPLASCSVRSLPPATNPRTLTGEVGPTNGLTAAALASADAMKTQPSQQAYDRLTMRHESYQGRHDGGR